jgi:beta-glucosidase
VSRPTSAPPHQPLPTGSATDPDVRARAVRIVAGLPRDERIQLLSGRDFWTTHEVPGAGSFMLTDGPHGLRKQAGETDHVGIESSVPATCFPVAAALASSWDPDLLEEVGAALGREARAEGVAVLLGPGLNLKRHPRGGRNFEYFSEDPFLSGTLAAAVVRGIQSQGVAACPKHYAANNQETMRMVIDTIIDERTLRELYLRGFEIVVRSADPWALMTSYNQVNGQFASDHGHLLGDVLRGEWAFDGLVVSDWGGTNDRVAGLRVGMDLEMPGGADAFAAEITRALDTGELAEADLDRCATRVVHRAVAWQQLRSAGPAPSVDHDAHHALARRAAAAGTVLLTNDGILPLPGQGSLAIVGAFAEEPRYQGAGSSQVNPTRVDTLRAALVESLGGEAEVTYSPGYEPGSGETTPALLAAAAAAARGADRVVLVVGVPSRWETEARDRPTWSLPEAMDRLVEVVVDANPRTVVVLVNGASVDLPWADRPAALVEAHLGGQAGGSALAEVLLGAAEPGGRLAESVPFDVAQLPADANFPGSPTQVQYRETFHVGYRFHDTTGTPARFPFGHGLSYTSFHHGPIEVTGAGTDLCVSLEVTNTGSRAGSEVVQVYVRDVASCVPRPAKELAGFAKVHLEPGRMSRIRIGLDRRAFAVWDVAASAWLVESGEFEILVGASATDLRGSVTVLVDSPDTVTPVAATAGPVATDAEFAALLGHPAPAPRPPRPFTRISTPGDLTTSRAGRPVAALMEWGIRRKFGEDAEQAGDVARTVLAGLPLRAFVTMAGGRLSFAMLDRLIAGLNRDVRGVLRPRARQ